MGTEDDHEGPAPREPRSSGLKWEAGYEPVLPLRLDLEASVVTGEGVVVDRAGAFVVFDSIEDALSFVAATNGDSEEEVLDKARALRDALAAMRSAGERRAPAGS